jgi:glycosyltransferase domain-containing protein
MDTNFTVFLVLKDRPAYTTRLMAYWNDISFPFEIVIADGGKDKQIENVLYNKNNFPNLTYDYLRFPYDQSLDDYHEKMAAAIEAIDTPVASVLDNDDFMTTEGIYHSLYFLKNNLDYSSARGEVYPINTNRGAMGVLSVNPNNMYDKFKESIVANDALDRVVQQTTHFHGNWHNITRSNHLKASWNMINIVKPQNFRFTEQMAGYLNVLWGNGHRGNYSWLLHQHGERTEIDGNSLKSHFPPQDKWVTSEFWLEEFNKMTEVVGVAIAEYDGISVEDAMEGFTESYPYKVEAHIELFKSRVKEAKKIGYDEDRIQRLFDVVKKYNVKEVQPLGDLDFEFLSAQEEVDVLSKFLLQL